MLPYTELSPKIEGFLVQLDREPAPVRAMWCYAVFLLLVKNERARILGTRLEGETCHLILETTSGYHYDIIRPQLSPEMEQHLLEKVRELIRDDETAYNRSSRWLQ